MAEVDTCPDRTTLERLLAGLVPDEAAADLEQHLLGCPSCCQTVRELLPAAAQHNQSAAARLAAKLTDEQAVRDVASRVATLRLPQRSSPSMETLASDSERTGEVDDFATLLDPPQSPDEIGRFGGYRVLRLLGTGGMGQVWEAEDPQLRRHVAIKVMRPQYAKQAEHRERFLREARAAAAIDHSHIVTVYQVGEHRGLPFLAMQLLHGETLEDLLQRERRLSQAECLRVGRQMAEALAVAHRRGLIHRDVKPANTWLESDGGWVKLVDFGLAHAVEDDTHLTQTGTILGTPAFMSPEQARGDVVSPRSDLFSLGAVLYRMVTGVGAFQGPSTLAVLTSLALRNPEPPRKLNPDIVPEFSELIMRLLAKDAADRPQSADEVVQAIRTIEAKVAPTLRGDSVAPTLRGGETVAKGDRLAPPSRSAGATRRPRWPWIAAASAAALLLAGIFIIVRDKDGKILGTHAYPDAESAEVRHTETAKEPSGKRPTEPPAVIPEPASLDEWLKGRTVLTVAQDGKGQFKTIQAALDALQPGQVVELLDAGPYRETLGGTQTNFGLISRVGTVIELAGTRLRTWEKDLGNNHFFDNLDGCRLSGLTFVAKTLPESLPPSAPWLMLAVSGDLVVERCRFAGGDPNNGNVGVLIFWPTEGRSRATCVVRECCFDTALNLGFNASAPKREQRYLIERNWFRSVPQPASLTVRGRGDTLIIRHNVFDGTQPGGLHMLDLADTARLEVYNNTFVSGRSRFFGDLRIPSAMIRDNYFPEGVGAEGDTASALDELARSWQLGGNQYRMSPSGTGELPLTSDDTVGQPGFLSRDAASPDYLRVASASAEANRVRDDDGPTYLGALPPGPAPKKGDWFTRLIARSANVSPALREGEAVANGDRLSPPSRSAGATLPEPPPLEEWLKGRTILTVAQDGGGQFKTIQAALDVLKPGDVIEVLDRGPYRETLLARAPKDAGLISRAGTVIEPGEKRQAYFDGDTANFNLFADVDGFRLSGISFIADDLKDLNSVTYWVHCNLQGNLLVENCYFTSGRSPTQELMVVWNASAPPGAACRVRECLFDSAPCINTLNRPERPVAIIERNWFLRTALSLLGPGQTTVIRHNVFDGASSNAFSVSPLGGFERLEIHNNTIRTWSLAWQKQSATGVTILNNLFRDALTFGGEGAIESLAAAKRGWQVGHNEYETPPEKDDQFPLVATDFVGEPKYLSRDPKHSDYLRIASDSDEARRGAGGEWPAYLGALPPGPAPKDGDWLTRWIKVAPTLRGGEAVVAGDRDQSVVNWVRSLGGTIGCTSAAADYVIVKPDEKLPAGRIHLITVDLTGKPVGDADLVRFDLLTRLTTLVLNGTSIGDQGLVQLGNLPELTGLYLVDTNVGDAGLREIARRFPKIKALHAGGTNITDVGLPEILTWKDLEALRLGQTAITDRSIDTLAAIKSLRTAFLAGTGITRAGIERLHAKLPDCTIESSFGTFAARGETDRAPSDVHVPPSLEEWLKGRKILTVSQDGKGQFKTIQAALDALRNGQVVEVLDRGPYRETLHFHDHRDTGLISRAGAVIEFTGKRDPTFDKDPANDHAFGNLRGFRLSGFSFTAGELQDRAPDVGWIYFSSNGDLLIENCRFADRRPHRGGLLIYWVATAPRGAMCHLRNCLLETAATLNVAADGRQARAVVEQNWFKGTSVMIHGNGKHVVVRQNVFDGENLYGLSLLETAHIGRLEICNNTFLSRIFAHNELPATGVTLRNNLLLFQGILAGPAGAASVPAAAKGWEAGNNEYAEKPELANEFPKAAGDFIGQPKFLSDDRSARDYLRIAADSDEAKRGAGGDLPGYLGALPPGPAPAEGDWLTRWIESATVAPALRDGSDSRPPTATASPPRSVGATLPSPPPLDEWLEGRKILTVSQNGKADFKTIQAALDAVQAGQAVEILDRGPYRELLAVGEKSDFGLFSRAGAVIESGGTRKPTWDKDPADFQSFSNIGRFRMSGLSFIANADDLKRMKAGSPWFMLGANDDVQIENCRFSGGRPGEIEFLVYRHDNARPGAVSTVRECRFDSAMNVGAGLPQTRTRIVIERNWFRAPPQYMALHIGGPGELFVLRQNVFDTGDKVAAVVFQTGDAQRLEVDNNTFLTPLSFGVVDLARTDLLCAREVVLRNNLFLQGITASPGMEDPLSIAAQSWQASNNEYAPLPDTPHRIRATAADFVVGPRFLSRQPAERDYLRVPADSDEARRGAGGELPSYLGALPPGPAPAAGDWLTRWIEGK